MTPQSSQNSDKTTPLPYQREEFPEWLHDLRRFEIILVGSFPISFLGTTLIYDTVRDYGFNNAPTTAAESQEDITNKILISIGVSGAIAITDFIIHKIITSSSKD